MRDRSSPGGIDEQQCDDAEEGQGNDGSEPRQLEQNGTTGRRTSCAALRRWLCHAAIVSGCSRTHKEALTLLR
jgi:hypothetical protein